MGYRSQVAVKTTSEGFAIIQKRESEQPDEELKLLKLAESIRVTPTGNYRIDWDWIKWYEGYDNIKYFIESLDKLEELDIPYSFVRIGEDANDIEHKCNWTDDIPSTIQSLEPVVDINDDEDGSYEDWRAPAEDDMTHITNIMFDLFDKYENHDDIKETLRSLCSEGSITDEEYYCAMSNWDKLLDIWTKTRI